MVRTQEACTCTFPAMSLSGLGFRKTLASWSWKAFPLPLSQIFLVPSLLFAVLAVCLTVLIISETKPCCMQPLKGMHAARTTFSPWGIRRNNDIQYHWMRAWSFCVFIIQTDTKLLGAFPSPSKVARLPWGGVWAWVHSICSLPWSVITFTDIEEQHPLSAATLMLYSLPPFSAAATGGVCMAFSTLIVRK